MLGQAKYQIYAEAEQVELMKPSYDSGWATEKDDRYKDLVLEKGAYLVRITTYNPPLGSLYTLKISVKDQ